jgi:hypothetical protein
VRSFTPPYPRHVDLPGFVLRRKRRWVANGLPDYPLWIAALHIGRIFTKLDLRDRAAAIVYAFDRGLVSPGG